MAKHRTAPQHSSPRPPLPGAGDPRLGAARSQGKLPSARAGRGQNPPPAKTFSHRKGG